MSPQTRADRAEEEFCHTKSSPHALGERGDFDAGPRIMRHFSHRCRNSLSGIKLGLYLLKRELDGEGPSDSRWNELGRTYDEIEKLFDRLQRIYQSASLTVVRSPLGQLFAERLPLWRSRFPEWGRTILVDPPEQEVAGDFDPTHFGHGLDAFVAWRAESGDSHGVRLAWRVAAGQFEISWDEVPVQSANRNGACENSTSGGSPADWSGSLALLLLARVASDHGGELEARCDPSMSVTVRWPQCRDVPPAR
jgi:hypothetical protein